ncbi:MAG TPA: VanZ family protein [Acidobacteriota bacterium]|jgi:hypothetical protein
MAITRGIFSSPARAWTAVVLYTAFLYSTMTLAFNLYVRLYDHMGRPFMDRLMSWMYLPVVLAVLAFVVFFLPRSLGSYAAFVLICLALAYSLKYLEVPAKRFHFFQYWPLTFFVFDALRFRCKDRYLYVWTFALVTLIGLGDETLQGMVPKRHFGLLDVVVDSVAGLLTLAFIGFVMGEENYPWGRLTKVEGRKSKVEGHPNADRGVQNLE